MMWKFWRWQWWRPPPDTSPNGKDHGDVIDPKEVSAALERARAATDNADRQNLELRELAARARSQREENHFGRDLYRVMRTRRGG